MPRQDAETPQARGPLPSEPSLEATRLTPLHSWTSLSQLQATRSLSALVAAHRLPRLLQRHAARFSAAIFPINPGSPPPNTRLQAPPSPPHTHGLRRLSHHNCKQAGQPEGNFDVLRWCALPFCKFCHSSIDADKSRGPAERSTTWQQLTGRTRVRLAGSPKVRVQFSLRVSTRPRSASSSRQTSQWKRGHRRVTARAYWSRQVHCASRPARCWSAPRALEPLDRARIVVRARAKGHYITMQSPCAAAADVQGGSCCGAAAASASVTATASASASAEAAAAAATAAATAAAATVAGRCPGKGGCAAR